MPFLFFNHLLSSCTDPLLLSPNFPGTCIFCSPSILSFFLCICLSQCKFLLFWFCASEEPTSLAVSLVFLPQMHPASIEGRALRCLLQPHPMHALIGITLWLLAGLLPTSNYRWWSIEKKNRSRLHPIRRQSISVVSAPSLNVPSLCEPLKSVAPDTQLYERACAFQLAIEWCWID